MKILYHHRIRSKDGQYVHIEELTNALKLLGHEIIMVGPPIEEEEFGSDSGYVAILKKYVPKFLYELLEYAYSFRDYIRLLKAYKKHKPDCMYERYNLFFHSGVWLRRKYRIPMLLEINAPLYDERKKFNGIALDRFAKWTETKSWRAADYVLPVTKVLAERVIQSGVPDSRIKVIPNGINLDKFKNVPSIDEAKSSLGLSNKLVLGFVGFMREWHGLDNVIDIVSENRSKNWHLLLVGDGPARTNLEDQARRLGISELVTITGVIGREEIAKYISAFDVALQPQVVEYASPLKLFEYLALSRVIVAPDTNNIKEILDDGVNALLFDAGNNDDFIRVVRRACENNELRDRIALGAKKTIHSKGLIWINNAERVVKLFHSIDLSEQ